VSHPDAAEDRAAITDVVTRYAWALVDQDWASYRTCFTTDAALDFSSTGGPTGTPTECAAWMTGTMAGFTVTFNTIANVQILLDGDTATSRTAFTMLLKTASDPAAYIEVRGWYDDTHVRTPDGWRISSRTESLVDLRA
jgi:3-phenylpropionate/cinnamic acid dioxygenase small subunit